MKKSQLHAISRSYAQKRNAADLAEAIAQEIDLIYQYQAVYKTFSGFVNATGSKKLNSIKAALVVLEARLEQLKKCNCTSSKLDECLRAIEQCKKYIKSNEED